MWAAALPLRHARHHARQRGLGPPQAQYGAARFHRSSYAVGLSFQRQGTTLEAKTGAPSSDYATHGGGFPILLPDGTCIGAITVSGLPQREDHELIVAVLAEYLGQPLAELALS
jgi:uncharacterized protein (UPF0303 family)